jgi:hypothetical protein
MTTGRRHRRHQACRESASAAIARKDAAERTVATMTIGAADCNDWPGLF